MLAKALLLIYRWGGTAGKVAATSGPKRQDVFEVSMTIRNAAVPQSRPRLRTWASRILAVLAALIGLLVAAYVVLYVTKGRFLKGTFEHYASRYAERRVRVGGDFQFYLNPDIKFVAEGLAIDNPSWAVEKRLFTAHRIDTEVSIWKLIGGERRLRYLNLDGARIDAEIDQAGRNTWTFAGDEPVEIPAIDRAAITGSTLRFIDARQRADVRVRVGDVAAANPRDRGTVQIAGPVTFTGEGTVRGNPFKLRGGLTTPNAAATGGRVGLVLHAEVAQAVVDTSGTLPALTRLEGADLRFSGRGRSLREIAALFGRAAPATPFTLRGEVKPFTDGRTRILVQTDALAARASATAIVRRLDTIAGADVRFDASGGNLATVAGLFGKVLPSTAFKITGSVQPDADGRARLAVDANASQTQISVAGKLRQTNSIDGSDLRVAVRGRNLQDAFKLFGLISPATRPYRVTTQLTKTGGNYRFRNLSGRIGDSDIAGTVTADLAGARPLLTGDLRTRVLDILDVGPWIGFSPAKLDKPGGSVIARTASGAPRVIPDAPLAIEQLKAFDARIRYSADVIRTRAAKLSGLLVDLELKNSRLLLKPVAFDIFGGRLTSTIDLDASVRPVVTTYDIRMSRVPLGQLLTSFDIGKSGTAASVFGRIQLRGEGNTMQESLATANGRIALVFPAGTLWVRNIQLGKLDLQNYITSGILKKLKKPQEIRCGVVAFTVKDGISAADPVLFDTKRANFRGRGTFSFKDESLNLSVRGYSKEFSLFSGQSPVGIKGSFAAPSIRPISGQLLARVGVGVGLGVATGGIGAILAFIDLGGAKNVNCAAVEAAKTARQVDAAPADPKTRR